MEQNKRSQYLQEYLQYKENMSFLNYDPEKSKWTLEKIKGFSGVKFIELLNGQQEVITWLDGVVSAVQEGVSDWENECNALQAKSNRYEKERYETRLAMRMLLKAFKGDIKTKRHKEWYAKAEAIFSKYHNVADVLRVEALNGEGEAKDEKD